VDGDTAERDTRLRRLNAWLTLAANVGVLVGIIFLVFELRQNTVAVRSAAASSLQSSYSDIELVIAGNRDFADVLVKGRAAAPVDVAEELRLMAFYRTVLRGWQNSQYQHLSGTLGQGLWEGEMGFFKETIGADRGLYDYWASNKALYSPAFNALLESIAPEAPNRGSE